MKKFLFSLFVSCFIVSCAKLPPKTDENWYWWMTSIVRSYTMTYFEPPGSADDLIHYLELEGGSLNQGVLDSQYDFLKKNREKIIIFTDDNTTFMYWKNRKKKNALIGTSVETYCDYERGMQGSELFFDRNEDPIFEESYNNLDEALKIKLRSIHYKSPNLKWQRKEGEPFENVLILEYTNERGLINKCTNTPINVSSSSYFGELHSCLKEFCEEYQLKKIIIDSYIPTE